MPVRPLGSLCAVVLAVAMAWTAPASAVGAGPRPDVGGHGSSLFAVNIDPANEAAWQQSPPGRLAGEGFKGVRFVSRASIQPRIDALKGAGSGSPSARTERDPHQPTNR